MAAAIIASFVPAFARAAEDEIVEFKSIINGLEQAKISECLGADAGQCKDVLNGIIQGHRDIINAMQAEARASVQGNTAEAARLSAKIVQIARDTKVKNQGAREFFKTRTMTVSTKN